jgi:hypothetical protein
MLALVKNAIARRDKATLAEQIAAAEEEARTARAESERLAVVAAAELDDERAEDLLRQVRAQDRAARRAEALLPELRERQANVAWLLRQAAFEKHKKAIAAAAFRLIEAMEAAARANYAAAAARDLASQELGTVSVLPLIMYGGLCLPDLVATWRRNVDRQLEQLERAELPKPPAPPVPRSQPYYPPAPTDPPMLTPRPGKVTFAGAIRNLPSDPPPPPPASGEGASQPSAAPPAAPKRQPRRDPPAGDGQTQIHFVAGGVFDLGDGTQARAGDYVNLAAEKAQPFVEKGVANFVDAKPPPETSAAGVEGAVSAIVPLALQLQAEGAAK